MIEKIYKIPEECGEELDNIVAMMLNRFIKKEVEAKPEYREMVASFKAENKISLAVDNALDDKDVDIVK